MPWLVYGGLVATNSEQAMALMRAVDPDVARDTLLGARRWLTGAHGEGAAPSTSMDWCFGFPCASESVVLDVNGYERSFDLAARETLFVGADRKVEKRQLGDKPHRPCIFELVYFARPDSFLDDISVYKTRQHFGAALAEQWKREGAPQAQPDPDRLLQRLLHRRVPHRRHHPRTSPSHRRRRPAPPPRGRSERPGRNPLPARRRQPRRHRRAPLTAAKLATISADRWRRAAGPRSVRARGRG